MAEITDLQEQFETFLDVTETERMDAERDQDYVDHKQWTAEEVEALAARNQAPVVINRIKTKVNLLTGIQRSNRRDPKALPRTPKHSDDADSVTDSLRFVADNTDFEQTSSEVFTREVVWGYGAAIVEVDPESLEIQVEEILPDRFYYDPYSRRKDFADAKYMGIVIWMDRQDAMDEFPGAAADIDQLFESHTDSTEGTTFEDKPIWVDRKRARLRVCQHYFKEKGRWMVAYFTAHTWLIEPKDSPYQDEKGMPTCPIEAQTAYVDRDNGRYGEVRAYIWIQDEINHRRSRALYNLSTRQSVGERGAVDVSTVKQELAKSDGHVVVEPNMRFEVLDNSDVTAAQLSMYQEAKQEIDSVGANAALSGEPDSNLSGRAIQSLQQGGIAELGLLFDGHRSWERRIYRQMWNRIRQFWDEERWVRVTDDSDNVRWVALNQPVTAGQKLQEMAQQGDQRAVALLQQMVAQQDPRLNEVVEVRRNTTEMDVDIIVTDSPDFATLRQEQFETMAQLAQSYGPEKVPFEVMLELSDMAHKDAVKELLQPPEQEVDQEQIRAQQELQAEQLRLAFESSQLEVEEQREKVKQMKIESETLAAEREAKIRKDQADTEAQELENQVVRGQIGRVMNAEAV